MSDASHAEYRFGDDTTTVTTPAELSVRLAPDDAQPDAQDTASFLVLGPDDTPILEVTASHFSSGNRGANMDRFREILEAKCGGAAHPQAVMGDINTEVKNGEELQELADSTGLVVLVPSLKIRRLRGLQDQLHKRMERKDDYDSMFLAIEPDLVDASALAAVPHQNVAWPGQPERLAWKPFDASDVAQAWRDARILTDHGVLICPLEGGQTLSLGNAARANYDKYDITKKARIGRRTYLEGQQVIETEVASAVLGFVSDLPVSSTLSAETKATVVSRLAAYREALAPHYQTAFDLWDDADDLTSVDTPLGAAILALGKHAKTFVTIVRALSWEDVRDAPHARDAFRASLTDALETGLGLGDADGPLTGEPGFDPASFRAGCEAKITAAWERIIQRQSAGDLYKMWFAELLHGQTTGGMPIPSAVFAQPTEDYIAQRMRALGLEGTICVMVEALR
jgi:hypothetical protein